jgi:transcription elongation factor GreA-like protein
MPTGAHSVVTVFQNLVYKIVQMEGVKAFFASIHEGMDEDSNRVEATLENADFGQVNIEVTALIDRVYTDYKNNINYDPIFTLGAHFEQLEDNNVAISIKYVEKDKDDLILQLPDDAMNGLF